MVVLEDLIPSENLAAHCPAPPLIMVELQNSVVPQLNSHVRFWKPYVDDTLTTVKEGLIMVLSYNI